MSREEKIKKIQKAIDKLEGGIVKISKTASKKKTDTPMRDAFENRFSEYGPLPFAAALLDQDPPELSGPLSPYPNMMIRAGHFMLVAAVAAIETPLLLGRTVVGLFNGIAYKLGNVKIDNANAKVSKMIVKLEEKRKVLNELIELDNKERTLAQRESEEETVMA